MSTQVCWNHTHTGTQYSSNSAPGTRQHRKTKRHTLAGATQLSEHPTTVVLYQNSAHLRTRDPGSFQHASAAVLRATTTANAAVAPTLTATSHGPKGPKRQIDLKTDPPSQASMVRTYIVGLVVDSSPCVQNPRFVSLAVSYVGGLPASFTVAKCAVWGFGAGSVQVRAPRERKVFYGLGSSTMFSFQYGYNDRENSGFDRATIHINARHPQMVNSLVRLHAVELVRARVKLSKLPTAYRT